MYESERKTKTCNDKWRASIFKHIRAHEPLIFAPLTRFHIADTRACHVYMLKCTTMPEQAPEVPLWQERYMYTTRIQKWPSIEALFTTRDQPTQSARDQAPLSLALRYSLLL